MAQGDDKTKTKGTKGMFVMTHKDIARLKGKTYTYANIVLDHCPQKEDPNRIRITAGGNLIQCDKDYWSEQRTSPQQSSTGTALSSQIHVP